VGDRPIHLLEAGIVTEQRYAGVSEAPAALGALFADRLGAVKRIRVPFNPRDRWLTAAREACRVLADAVTLSLRAGATVVILGGECTLVAGAVPGALEVEPDLTLIYLDAHADFNTLATTPSHFVGGMCLAHVCGRPVAALLWPGARRMTDERTVLVGARQLDLGESGNLLRSRILRIPFDREQPDAPGLLAAVRRRAVWVHIDVDVVDPREMPAVVGPVEGGPGLAALRDLLAGIAQVSEVRGMELCGYDPRQGSGRAAASAACRRGHAAVGPPTRGLVDLGAIRPSQLGQAGQAGQPHRGVSDRGASADRAPRAQSLIAREGVAQLHLGEPLLERSGEPVGVLGPAGDVRGPRRSRKRTGHGVNARSAGVDLRHVGSIKPRPPPPRPPPTS